MLREPESLRSSTLLSSSLEAGVCLTSTLSPNRLFEWTVTSLLPLSKFHRAEHHSSSVLHLSWFIDGDDGSVIAS